MFLKLELFGEKQKLDFRQKRPLGTEAFGTGIWSPSHTGESPEVQAVILDLSLTCHVIWGRSSPLSESHSP